MNPFIEGILRSLGQKSVEVVAGGLSRSGGSISKPAPPSLPPGETQTLFIRGLENYDSKPYIAVQFFQVAAERGHAPSQSYLGVCLQTGHGCREDKAEGKKWLQLAAQSGDELAIKILAHHRLFDDFNKVMEESDRALAESHEFLAQFNEPGGMERFLAHIQKEVDEKMKKKS